MHYDRRSFDGLQLNVVGKFAAFAMLAVGVSFPAPAAAQQPGQKTFPFAADATKALVEALQADDQSALLSILGPDAKDIISSGDEVEDKNDRDLFVQKLPGRCIAWSPSRWRDHALHRAGKLAIADSPCAQSWCFGTSIPPQPSKKFFTEELGQRTCANSSVSRTG